LNCAEGFNILSADSLRPKIFREREREREREGGTTHRHITQCLKNGATLWIIWHFLLLTIRKIQLDLVAQGKKINFSRNIFGNSSSILELNNIIILHRF
jgi:hypothetical protein